MCKDRLTLVVRNMPHNQSTTLLPPVPIHFSLIEDAENFFLSHYGSTWEGIIGLGYPKLMMDNIPTRKSQVEQVLSHSPWIRVLWKLFERTPEQLHPFETLTSAWNLPNMFSLLLCGMTQLNVEFSIVDSGTTNIQFPERVFQPLLRHIKTYLAKQSSSTAAMLQNYASFWAGASMLCETSSDNQIGGATGLPYTLFPVIEFQMLVLDADVNREALSLTLSPQQYIRFVGRHPKNGVMRDCFAFGIRPHHSGTILGAVFLEGFFTVFHRDSLQVGFGNSTCNRYSNMSTVTSSMVNGVRAWKSSIGRKTPSECAFHRPVSPEWMEFIRIANVVVSIFTFIVIIMHFTTSLTVFIYQHVECCR
ncbi:hypothetical protein CRM22_009442 [Opisthorchis felineus]|uniref:Peptidase A1 domain-containing protein n=2 Tax=Opisthorchis felineus TaxID=147828 RepID=A0A4S2L6P8_OPIFE|nr:hypothetical protein CRM22_009442 [Opisthorchis felineus]